MAFPTIEIPSGTVNGVNQVFLTSLPYVPGELSVFLNGLLQSQNFVDGWTETSPSGGVVTLNVAPQVNDTVQIYYLPAVGGGVVSSLRGVIATADVLAGTLRSDSVLRGVVCRCTCS